jgi:hypothetical protein
MGAKMKAIIALLAAAVLLYTAVPVTASGRVGIYAVISKVVFEPNATSPERIQIWGAFTLVNGGTGSAGKTLTPKRGYLYFMLPSASDTRSPREAALKEWADFKAIAGTGQAVAFGDFGYIGEFSDSFLSERSNSPSMSDAAIFFWDQKIRGERTAPQSPDRYPLNMGLTKLSDSGNLAATVKQLKKTLDQ